MAIPYITRANYSISINDDNDLEKVANLGTQVGFNTADRDSWVTMTNVTPSTYTPKIFYVKGTGQWDGLFTAYAVVNKYKSDHYLCVVEYMPEGFLHQYSGTFQNITGTDPNVPGVWYANVHNATFNIVLEKLNPMIPVFDTLEDGLLAAKNDSWVWVDPDDPYEFDDSAISYSGGGTGKFNNTSDVVGVPALPNLSAVSAGFISMYSPTLTQLNQLASFLWTDSAFDPDNFKKLFSDPMECIIGLTIVPVEPPSYGATSVKIGYINTGISMDRLASQYVAVDCGSIQCDEFWGSALDYSPQTKLHLYLPYCRTVELNADEVIGRSLGVVYHVDCLSGGLTAFVTVNGSVIAQYNGQCAMNIPMAASNFSNMIQGAISAIGAVSATAATGGGAAITGAAGMGLGVASIGANAANGAIANKPSFSHSGSMGGAGGMMGVQTPYLIIERPRQSVPADLNKFCGYPSNINYKLFDLAGYTQVEYIHLDGFTCTDAELKEIDALLKAGVIL